MQAADQAGVIRIEADRHHLDFEVLSLENDIGARDRELADPALAKAAADHDAFGIGPALGLEKAPRHIRQFLREFLDRTVHQRSGADVVAPQSLVEPTFADGLGGFAAERILAVFLQRLAQRVQNFAERTFAGAVAEKALVVLQFDIVAVHVCRRQAGGAVPADAGGRQCVFSHFALSPVGSRGYNGAGTRWFHRPDGPIPKQARPAANVLNPLYLADFCGALP